MGLISWLMDLDDLEMQEQEKKPDDYKQELEDYYEDSYNFAMEGDEEARAEMEAEFGDDWEDEY